MRDYRKKRLRGRIVETEAYYGQDDPASRAYSGNITPLNAAMWQTPGTIMVYMVHNNWLFNIVTLPEHQSAAVLIRALEPMSELQTMLRHRQQHNASIHLDKDLCSGPGKLTQAFAIDKKMNHKDVLTTTGIWIERSYGKAPAIATSHRIGVSRDVPQDLRFYIPGNPHVSKGPMIKRT